MQETLVRSTLRTFLKVIAAFFGIGLGILLVSAMLSGLNEAESTALKIETDYSPELLPNAQGERKLLGDGTPVLWQLNIVGTIGTEFFNQNTVRQQLAESREGVLKNNRVKGILLYINSPGGTVSDSDAIYRAIKEYKERYKVPVYAFIDGMCASGGLYIACAADKVYATPNSLIGSVGVLTMPFFNFHKLIDKIGVQALTVYAGKGKDELDPWRPWKEGEQEHMQQIVDTYYQRFVDIVTEARPAVDRNHLVNDYGALVFVAAEAERKGLVDNAQASLSQVIQELARVVGIHDANYQLVALQKKSWFKELFREHLPLQKSTVTHQIDWGDGIHASLRGQLLYLYHPER